MNRREFLSSAGALSLAACALSERNREPRRPVDAKVARGLADHHTHVFSNGARAVVEEAAKRKLPSFTVAELLPVLDEGEIARAAVLSVAYFFAKAGANSEDDTQKMRAENDWVAEQVAGKATRLAAFFSVNPLADDVLAEIDRCASTGAFVGTKLHFANSKVDLHDPDHIVRLRRLFAHINHLKLPTVVHVRTTRRDFGSEDVEAFVNGVLQDVPEVPLQVAHGGGWGGYDGATEASFGAFAAALERGALRRESVWFDVSAVVRGAKATSDPSASERYKRLVDTMRRIGLRSIVFGSDWPEWTPASYRRDLEDALPLERKELTGVLENVVPWLQHDAARNREH